MIPRPPFPLQKNKRGITVNPCQNHDRVTRESPLKSSKFEKPLSPSFKQDQFTEYNEQLDHSPPPLFPSREPDCQLFRRSLTGSVEATTPPPQKAIKTISVPSFPPFLKRPEDQIRTKKKTPTIHDLARCPFFFGKEIIEVHSASFLCLWVHLRRIVQGPLSMVLLWLRSSLAQIVQIHPINQLLYLVRRGHQAVQISKAKCQRISRTYAVSN